MIEESQNRAYDGKREIIKSELEKLKEFYASLNADMFGEKLQKGRLDQSAN